MSLARRCLGRLGFPLWLGFIVPVLAWNPPRASGQVSHGTTRGSVLDTLSGNPVAGALLRFDTGQDVKTGPDGLFSISGLDFGTRSVAIVTAGCRVSFASFEVRESSPAPLVFRVGVRDMEGPVVPPDPLPGNRLFSSRDIEEMRVGTMVALLRRVAPRLIQSESGQPGALPRITSRGVASGQGPVSPLLVVDGVNLGSLESAGALEMIQPADIAYLELFEGSIGGWSYGTGGSGGVIRVTTKRGRSLSPPDADLRNCPIPRWR